MEHLSNTQIQYANEVYDSIISEVYGISCTTETKDLKSKKFIQWIKKNFDVKHCKIKAL